jgi:Peptidase A4 family
MKVIRYSRASALSLFILPLINATAFAQFQADPQLTPNRMATNLAGATTAIAPPEYFDPLVATPEELATYGFPPRPDAGAEPKAYATWKKAMVASKTRITPHLEQTNLFHGPRREPVKTSESTGTSSNWSGAVDFSGATSYNSSSTFYYIIADYVVPVATQAYGVCTGSWDYSSSWVGIDGDGSGDVLQAGSESDAYCNGSNKSTYYSAWYEWYPYGEVRISNLPVSPGDDIFVEVWHTSSTQGYAYMVNYNTNQWVDIGFRAPAGTSLIGNSAEWVVERPGISTGLATLTNYISDYFSDAYAYTENYTQYTPGSYGALLLTMTDNNGYRISYPTLLGATGIWFQDEGSAR